ncbi:MAG: glycoside hydrolase [Bacteroides cellulosilyticus]
MRYKVSLLVFTVVCASCAQRADINYRIVTGQPLQVMEHFGASDAWSMHVLGKWPEEKQKQIADWLFSTENDANGKPKGIGLSLWRFNLGAGSSRSRATPARLVLLDAYRMLLAAGREL